MSEDDSIVCSTVGRRQRKGAPTFVPEFVARSSTDYSAAFFICVAMVRLTPGRTKNKKCKAPRTQRHHEAPVERVFWAMKLGSRRKLDSLRKLDSGGGGIGERRREEENIEGREKREGGGAGRWLVSNASNRRYSAVSPFFVDAFICYYYTIYVHACGELIFFFFLVISVFNFQFSTSILSSTFCVFCCLFPMVFDSTFHIVPFFFQFLFCTPF